MLRPICIRSERHLAQTLQTKKYMNTKISCCDLCGGFFKFQYFLVYVWIRPHTFWLVAGTSPLVSVLFRSSVLYLIVYKICLFCLRLRYVCVWLLFLFLCMPYASYLHHIWVPCASDLHLICSFIFASYLHPMCFLLVTVCISFASFLHPSCILCASFSHRVRILSFTSYSHVRCIPFDLVFFLFLLLVCKFLASYLHFTCTPFSYHFDFMFAFYLHPICMRPASQL